MIILYEFKTNFFCKWNFLYIYKFYYIYIKYNIQFYLFVPLMILSALDHF